MVRPMSLAAVAAAAAALVAGAGAAVVSSDSSGTVVLDGAKAFPIVLAKGPERDSTTPGGKNGYAAVAAAGVTMLKIGPATTPWTTADIAAANADDEAAAANGLSTWVNLSTVGTATAGSAGDLLLQQVVGSLKADPGSSAIAMWKGVDEPFWSGDTPGELQFAYCRSTGRGTASWCGGEPVLDSDHAWVTIEAPRGTAAQIEPYSSVTDIHGVDVYPVTLKTPTPDLHQVGAWTSTVAAATPSHAVWTTLEICASGNYDGTGTFVLPTFTQERYMAYDAIVNGARSLAFYGGNNPGCWSPSDTAHGWNWTFWDSVLEPLVSELSAASPLAPALVSAASSQTVATSDATTEAISRTGSGKDLWVIAARAGAGTAAVTFSGLPADISSGTVYTEGRSVSVSHGSFTDDFDQWAVHVYRFVPTATPPPETGGGSGGSAAPPADLALTLAANTQTPSVGQESDLVATVSNHGGSTSEQTHLVITLPPAVTLLGPPFFERGSGCTGTRTLDCNLDTIPNGTATPIKFAVRIDGSGAQLIQATASSSRDADNADNAATLTLEVPVTTPAPTPPKVVAPVRCKVPKLGGKTLAQARAVVVRARCSVGRISRKPSIRVLRGRVSTQSPAAGATLRRGGKVNLTLSTGRPSTR